MTAGSLLAGIFLSALVAQSQPTRDAQTSAASGTAVVSGLVTSTTEPAMPLRRARVTLASAELSVNRTIVTDETGTYMFAGVPPGRFTLAAVKEGFVDMAYGARVPGRPGISLAVADGARLNGLTIRLPRGGVITGIVNDPMGLPMPNVQVSAMQYGYVNGERRLTPRGSASSDDRGIYRIFGLRPGQYLVQASISRMMTMSGADVLLPSAADIDRALQESASGSTAAAQKSAGNSMGVGRPTAIAPVYYPGGPSPNQAAVIDVAAGQERSGIDLQLLLVPSGRVEGTVSWPGGAPPPVVQVTLVGVGDGAASSEFKIGRVVDGKFQFGSLSPGDYAVAVRANDPGGKPGAALWATGNVRMDGTDVVALALELRPGFEVSGRIQFQADGKPPGDARGWRVNLASAAGPGHVTLGASPADVQPDGTFTIRGVTPGPYFVVSTPPATAVDNWMVRTITLAGRDLGEQPLAIQGDVDGVVVTFTDRVSQITGRLQDPSGAPAFDYHIIVFPADRALWTSQTTSRIQAVRPSVDGGYIVRRLPPGEYLMVAMLDVETGEWSDLSFLQRIAASGVRVTLADGEQKVQDLRVSR